MPKLIELRELARDLVLESRREMRLREILDAIVEQYPDVPRPSLNSQVSGLDAHYPNDIVKPRHGVYAPRAVKNTDPDGGRMATPAPMIPGVSAAEIRGPSNCDPAVELLLRLERAPEEGWLLVSVLSSSESKAVRIHRDALRDALETVSASLVRTQPPAAGAGAVFRGAQR